MKWERERKKERKKGYKSKASGKELMFKGAGKSGESNAHPEMKVTATNETLRARGVQEHHQRSVGGAGGPSWMQGCTLEGEADYSLAAKEYRSANDGSNVVTSKVASKLDLGSANDEKHSAGEEGEADYSWAAKEYRSASDEKTPASTSQRECSSTKGKAKSFEELRKKRAALRKKTRLEQQARQPQGTSYWTKHKGEGKVRPKERIYPKGFKGQMYPTGAAANHPAAASLRQWATEGCPVDTGPQWTME